MASPTESREPDVLTGYAGFIGGHVCSASPAGSLLGIDRVGSPALDPERRHTVDLTDARALSGLGLAAGGTLLHLAAEAEVAIPYGRIGDVVDANVAATLNALDVLRPSRVVFTSSSAVYGNARAAAPDWDDVRPVGLYGMTKAIGEWTCRSWAAETGGTAVVLRLGNVVGSACRGFIPHLVRHALAHPDGGVPVRARGGGRLARDYVPVEHVVDVLRWSARAPAREGVTILNVGCGRPWTNGEVGAVVQRVLAAEGFSLDITWDSAPLPGEAEHVVLDVERTRRVTGLAVPSHEAVEASIEDATRCWIGAGRTGMAKSPS